MKLTRQQAFEKALKGLLAQGRPCISWADARCVYIAEDGTRDPIGHLLARDQDGHTINAVSMMDISVRPLPDRARPLHAALERAEIDTNDGEFLLALVRLHDDLILNHSRPRPTGVSPSPFIDWKPAVKYGAQQMARRFNLDTAFLA